MPVSKLSMKVLSELNVETYTAPENKIEVAISSRGQILRTLLSDEVAYLDTLEKLLDHTQSSHASYTDTVKSLISTHTKLKTILTTPKAAQMTQLDEVYVLRDVSLWACSFNKPYIEYSRIYEFDPKLPESAASLEKAPFIRFKAITKLLERLYEMLLHFENSIPQFSFLDPTLRRMFVEITNNFGRASRFAVAHWGVVKDYLNNERLYVDYFTINFSVARSLNTLQKVPDSECRFDPNRILKRDYFELELRHPTENTSKKIVELMLLSDIQAMDYNSIHKSHTDRSLEKLARIESSEALLLIGDTDLNDGSTEDSTTETSFMSHIRGISTISSVNTDEVEESYKGTLGFKFGEIRSLAICAIDAQIGRNLVFPAFTRGSLRIKTINKAQNEIVLVSALGKATLRIASLEAEQFNNWMPFLRVLFPFFSQDCAYFEEHAKVKKGLGLGALGINLSTPTTTEKPKPTVSSKEMAYSNNPILAKRVSKSKGKSVSSSTSIEDFKPLRLRKRETSNKVVSKQNKKEIWSNESTPQLDSFLEKLENTEATPSSFNFDEINYSNSNSPAECDNTCTTLPSSTSCLSRLSKLQKMNNLDRLLVHQHNVLMFDDDESDWTSITSTSNVSLPKVDVSDVLEIMDPFYEKKRSSKASIEDLKHIKAESVHKTQGSLKVVKEEGQSIPPAISLPKIESVSAFATPSVRVLDIEANCSDQTLGPPKPHNTVEASPAKSVTISEAAEQLKDEFEVKKAEPSPKKTSSTTKTSFFKKTPLFKKLFGRSKKENNFVFDNKQSTEVKKAPKEQPKPKKQAQRGSVMLKKKMLDEEDQVAKVAPKPAHQTNAEPVAEEAHTAMTVASKRLSKGPSRNSIQKGGVVKSASRNSMTKAGIVKSSSRNLIGSKRLSYSQQRLLGDLVPKYTSLVIPNNYSVSLLESPSPQGDSGQVLPLPLKFASQSSGLALFDKSSFALPSKNSFALISKTSFALPSKNSFALISKTSFALPSKNSFALVSKTSFALPSKTSFALPTKTSLALPSKASFLLRSTASNLSFVTGLTHQETSNNSLGVLLTPQASLTPKKEVDKGLQPPSETSLESKELTVIEKPELDSEDVSDCEDIPVPKEEDSVCQAPIVELDSSSDSVEMTTNANNFSNFGKSFEPKFYSDDEPKKTRKLKLLSLKRKKSVDFEIVSPSIKSPGITSPSSILATPVSLYSPGLNTPKRTASPLMNSLIRKDKNQKNLTVTTGKATPPKSNLASSFASITEQYLADVENCVVVYKDWFYVSNWKLDRWESLSDDLMYSEVVVSVKQSYLCLYKSELLKASLASIKPFVILPIGSAAEITKGSESVQIKTFNEYSRKTNMVCLRARNQKLVLGVVLALQFAQKEHTQASLTKTRAQLLSTQGRSYKVPQPEVLPPRKIRLHKKSSITGKWNPIAISRLELTSRSEARFKVVVSDFKTEKQIIKAIIDGAQAQRIGRTGVCIVVPGREGGDYSRPNYLLESRNELEADELYGILTASVY